MTAASPLAGPRFADAARDVIALATGREPRAATPAAWDAVATMAIREACGPLVWHRAAPMLRTHAPSEVVDRLRAHAIDQALRLERRLTLLRDTLESLRAADVAVVVLKGMPLSRLLYDDAFVRPSADVDLLVPAPMRGRARHALFAGGWRLVEGAAPGEEVFLRPHAGAVERLEVHSFALGDMLSHLPVPTLRSEAASIGDVAFDVLSPPAQALTLATHLSQHAELPLLFALDYATLRRQLDPAGWAEAEALARSSRATRYLAFAAGIARAVDAVAEATPSGDGKALRRLGFSAGRGAIGHPMWRDLSFAETGADRVRLLLRWLMPPRVRHAPGGALNAVRQRALRLLRRASGRARPTRRGAVHGTAAARSLDMGAGDLGALVSEVTSRGGTIWIRARGDSMMPSIPSGASVRLGPLPTVPIPRGDVVLATLPGGRIVLHRVLMDRDGVVALRGDANVAADRPTARAAVHGRAEVVHVGDRTVAVGRRPSVTLRTLLRRARAHAAAAVQRVRR